MLKNFALLTAMIILAAILIGCTRSRAIVGPDGREAHHINCGGILNSNADCFEKAGEICGPQGYTILGQEERARPNINFYSGQYMGEVVSRHLIIACNSPAQAMTPVSPPSSPPIPIPPLAEPTDPVQYPDFKTVQKAAQGGDAHAQFLLGALYADGEGGVSQNYTKALQWFQKAADQGHAAGQYSLARMHIQRLGGATRDENKILELLLNSADQGYADAQLAVGIVYADQKNHALAKQWFQKAADQGQTQARAILATGF